jgi:glutamyl-tRNA(Gln) amidotransferase subunit D
MVEIGDRVLVDTVDKQIEGVMMPSSKKDSLVIKLDSGYNLGILQKSVRKIKVVKKNSKPKSSKVKVKKDPKKKTIVILHTGGTIASKVDYNTGAVHTLFTPEEIVSMFPELGGIANIESRLIRNMWSEDMNFQHYNLMAKEVAKEVKKGVDGIIITHGTDTIHYTSTALAFVLEDLSIPVLIVGAQRSSDRGSSDAAMNLVCAVEFMTKTEFAGIGVCMHKNTDDDVCWVLPPTKCKKMHSSRRDAFQPVNAKPYAEVDWIKHKVKIVDNSFIKRSDSNLKLKFFKEVKVGVYKARPNMLAEELLWYKNFDGLVLEGYGLAGNFPINEQDIMTKENGKVAKAIIALAKKMPVALTTQTVFGRINQNVYSTGRYLQEMNVLGNHLDMTTETAYIKLAWLLSNHPKEVKELYSKNLRGEINERIGSNFL